jgi:hypothetical protein
MNTKILFILLFLFGYVNNLNNDHCDLFSEYSEECADIILECEEVNGTYTIIDSDDYENNSACCCAYD